MKRPLVFFLILLVFYEHVMSCLSVFFFYYFLFIHTISVSHSAHIFIIVVLIHLYNFVHKHMCNSVCVCAYMFLGKCVCNLTCICACHKHRFVNKLSTYIMRNWLQCIISHVLLPINIIFLFCFCFIFCSFPSLSTLFAIVLHP